MKSNRSVDKTVRRGALLCAAGAAGIAAVAWLSWAFDGWRLTTFGADYIPMAPITAALLIVLAAATFLRAGWPDPVPQTFSLLYRGFPTRGEPAHPQPSADWKSATQQVGNLRYGGRARWLARSGASAFGLAAIFVTALLSLSVLLPERFGLAAWVEHALAPTAARVGGLPVGRMSPLTAWAFLLAAAALLLPLIPLDRGRLGPRLSAGLALAVVLIGLVVLLGYSLGAPLLYGGPTIPMALLTAAAFALLGLALLLASGAVQWGLDLLTGGSAAEPASVEQAFSPAGGAPKPTVPVLLLVIFVCLAGAIGMSGFFYLKRQMADSRRTAQESLAAIADLKVGQIARWRKDHLAFGRTILESGALADQFQQLLADPTNAAAKDLVLSSMTAWQKHLRYARVRLWDQDQQVRFAVPAGADRAEPADAAFVAQALRTNEVLLPDLHLDRPAPEHACMDVFVPLLPTPGVSAGAATPLGVLQLEIDPGDFLWPLIQGWPTASPTAETLLLRREGNEVLYLNELRHRTNTALRLRLPLTRTDVPAVRAALGEVGLREGVDYRGARVFAATRAIPDSPWRMVAKMDQAEIYAPLRQQALTTGFIVAVLLLATLVGAALHWRQRHLGFLRHALAQEKQRLVLTERLAFLSKNANDIILLAGPDQRILDANDRALETYGYSLAELRQMTLRDLRPPAARAASEQQTRQVEASGASVFETVHQRKDGTCFPVEVSACTVEAGGARYYQGILRDITERKEAEAAQRLLIDTLKASLNEIYIFAADTLRFRFVNDSALRNLGYTAAQMAAMTPLDLKPAFTATTFHELVAPLRRRERAQQVFDTEHRRADGSLYPVEVHLQLIESGQTPVFLAVIQDITERKQAEQERQKFFMLAESSSEFIGMCDLELQPLYVNPAGVRMVGLPDMAAACRVKVQDYFFPEDQRFIAEEFFPRVMREGHGDVEIRLRHFQTGEAIWFFYYLFSVRDASGTPVGWATVSRDITERKRAETETRRLLEETERGRADLLSILEDQREAEATLVRERQFLAAVLDNIGEAVVACDAQGRLTRFNQAARDLHGLPETPITPEQWAEHYDLYQADGQTPLRKQDIPLFRALQGGRVWEAEMVVAPKRGEARSLVTNGQPMRDAEGRLLGAVVAMHDITERKRAEAQIQEQLEELQHDYSLMLGREERVMELKREVNALLCEAGQPSRYPSQEGEGGVGI
jgi:PAS domain S-box-containing protein